MSRKVTREEIRKLIIASFELDPRNLPATLDVDSIEKWDSLGHMTLMEAIEESFGVALEHAVSINLLSEEAIARALEAE